MSAFFGTSAHACSETGPLLQVEKGLLHEEARYAQKENQLLRLRNTELEDKVPLFCTCNLALLSIFV